LFLKRIGTNFHLYLGVLLLENAIVRTLMKLLASPSRRKEKDRFCVPDVCAMNGEFEEKARLAYKLAIFSSMACPSILIQGPRRGCTERRLFGVSIATATKLPLQRPPDGCVSTFHPLSRPIESYRACNHPKRARCINRTSEIFVVLSRLLSGDRLSMSGFRISFVQNFHRLPAY